MRKQVRKNEKTEKVKGKLPEKKMRKQERESEKKRKIHGKQEKIGKKV